MTIAEYQHRVQSTLRDLGIPANYQTDTKLPLYFEAQEIELVLVENDAFGRAQKMHVQAAKQWKNLKQAAFSDGIELLLVSAFRSVEYQKNLITKKLNSGISIEEILKVNAAPGFSEHHTGLAVDLGTPGFAHLSVDFEKSPAFLWLSENANQFEFHLSFPRGNPHKISYEPWHWALRNHSSSRMTMPDH